MFGCAGMSDNIQGDNSYKIFAKFFFNFSSPTGPHPGRTLPANHRDPNHFWFSTRIARCIAVIGGAGGCLHGRGWGRVSVRVRAVWRGGLHHRRAGALLAEMGNTLLRSGRSTALRPTGPFPVPTGEQGSAKSTLMLSGRSLRSRRARRGKVWRAISTAG